MRSVLTLALLAAPLVTTACTHQVEVIAPKEPIRIELAVRIDQEVRVRLDKDVESLIDNNPDLF